MQDNGWGHGLSVAADGNGLVGHGGGILLRKVAGRLGLTAELDGALTQKGAFPQLSRGMALVSTAAAIAMGATAMAGIEVPGQLAPVLGDVPGDSTARRTPELADDRVLTRIAQARARIRKRAWELIAATEPGFPWLAAAGKTLSGWIVLDMDGTLVTAYSPAAGPSSTPARTRSGRSRSPRGCRALRRTGTWRRTRTSPRSRT